MAATRPYHHGDLRNALLESAEAVVRERGVQELSLRELAREAGVSHAAPRRHFRDRQALLDALAASGFARLGADLRAAADRPGAGFETRLTAAATAYFRFATEHAALLELMFSAKHQPGADALRASADAAFQVLLDLIAEGQAAGALVAGDVHQVGTIAFATLQGLAAMANGGMLADAERDQLVRGAVEQMLHGLRPR